MTYNYIQMKKQIEKIRKETQKLQNKGENMQIQTIKFFKNKETGAFYGMRTPREDNLIPDPEQAWKRIKKTGKGWNPQVVNDDLVVVDFPDELCIYIKQN